MQLVRVKIGGRYYQFILYIAKLINPTCTVLLLLSSLHFYVFQAVELQKLILAHNDIQTLKQDLRNLPQLTVLNVSHNKLSNLPPAIGEYVTFYFLLMFLFSSIYLTVSQFLFNRLQMLKLLDVSFNLIRHLPQQVGSAASLVKQVSFMAS